MYLIVGLGNPGAEYEQTRHNVGFLVVEKLAGDAKWSNKKAFKGEVAELHIGKEKCFLLKPQTYMNLSGESVRLMMDFYKIPLEQLIVVHDDADLPAGDIRIQTGRGAAGHNGVQSIIDSIGSVSFKRCRVGIGRSSNPEIPLDVFVLEQMSGTALKEQAAAVEEASQLIKNQLD